MMRKGRGAERAALGRPVVLPVALLLAAVAWPAVLAAQETLYNGIVLPPGFPASVAPTQAFRPATYLSAPPPVVPIDVGRQLFVDNFLIESTTLARVAHRPTLYPGNPVLTGDLVRDVTGLAFPYSDGVWYDPDTRVFKMWYDGGYGNDLAYATSTDGKTWVKPSIPDAAAVPGSNLVMAIGGSRESVTVWRDALDPDPSRRYKAFVLFNIPFMHIHLSGDGIHWSDPAPNNMNTISDRGTVFYNPFRKVWVESARSFVELPATGSLPAHSSRVRYYSESRDLTNWTDPSNVYWAGPDEFDPPYVPGGALPELYALDAVAYESLMVGMFSWFNPGPSYQPTYGPGPNLVELGVGFSRDGFQWVRPTRGAGPNAFIPASNVDGTWNCCNTQSAGGGFLVVGDELWFYFSARTARKPATGQGSTGLAMLRRDGFYSMDSAGAGGVLTTRPVTFAGNHLFVNAAAAGGSVQAEVLDLAGNVIAPFSRANSGTVSSDTTRSEIIWAGGDLSTVANRPVKFRFYVSSASLYSFWVTPSAAGASFGYIAAGGPGLTGAIDTFGSAPLPPLPPVLPPPPPAPGLAVTLTSPADGAVLVGTVGVTATASGPSPISAVAFLIDGAVVTGNIAAPPYRFDWNTAPYGNGAHTVGALARDATGKIVVATVNVTLANGIAPPPPPIGVSVSPPAVSLPAGASQQLTATVTNGAASGVIWSLSPNVGTISASGLYTSPATVAAQTTVTAVATSLADLSKTASAAVTLLPPLPAAPPAGPALRYVAAAPCRVADTRNAAGPFGGPALAAGSPRDFNIAASGCGVPATAAAYALNVTVVPHGPLGFLSVWPAGQPQPLVSTLNSLDARVKANAAIVSAGAGGAITVFASSATDVVIDLSGYFVPAAGLAFYPVAACRLVDTRNALGPFGAPSLAGGAARSFLLSGGACGIPSTAQAYVLNATVVPVGPLGFLTLWPAGQPQPPVSTLNALTGAVTSNLAIVGAGAGGGINALATSTADLILDVTGYFAPPGAGSLDFYAATPCRVLDTRVTTGPLGAGVLNGLELRSFFVPWSGCAPPTAKAYSMNATVVPLAPLGFLTLWGGGAQPATSTLNSLDGTVAADAAIVVAGPSGAVTALATSPTHLVLDINGYFQ